MCRTDDHMLKFDGLISTSNCMIRDVVEVETSGPVVWITKLKDRRGIGAE